MDSHKFLTLPEPVKALVKKICLEQNQPPIDDKTCDLLAEIGLLNACTVLRKIDGQPIRKSFNGFIAYLVNNGYKSPVWSPSSNSPSTSLHRNCGVTLPSPQMNSASMGRREDPPLNRQLSFEDDTHLNPGFGQPASHNDLMKTLSRLEFRKLFMVLSYTGKQNLASVMTLDGAKYILNNNHLLMPDFEDIIWKDYGSRNCESSSRNQNYDWDRRKTHLYYYIHNDEGCYFKGPCLNNTRTHLQRSLGDDNVLVVKFSGKDESVMQKIAMEGIIVGDRHYKFFVFKDERERVKSDQNGDNKAPKCYFIHVDQNLGRSITDARQRFMHVHTLKTIEKYMARFSLILSKTINLDLGDFKIDTIDDIPLRDENNCIILDNDGEALIYTDGTGYISEDLAMKCPKDFASALYMKDNVMEGVLHHKRPRNNEPPLLIQCRLFHNGCAVKGTLLLNKKLETGTIQVRPSMIKVKTDTTLPREETFNSLEVNSVSRRPGRSFLSKNLIALLSYGKVPQKFFLDLLTAELEDTRNIYSNRKTALKVASNNDGLDFGSVAQRMLLADIPLSEPYLQHCLSFLEKDGTEKLKEGKIPIVDSFYLMGTADPTGLLDTHEVFVIYEHGPIVGDVLVYRNPGLHFGDIHAMKAVYRKELEDYIGNSKYGIFFSTKGSTSAAYEMATGDFDGDLYWISKHPDLLKTFTASEPWSEPKDLNSKKLQPPKLPESSLELERQLFRLFLDSRSSISSSIMATACHSWLSFMDRLLILPDESESEKNKLKEKMNKLINIYYDALDAPKSGKKVKVPNELKAEKFPHYMKKPADFTYRSFSVLGKIHDSVKAFQEAPPPRQEIQKLPCFDIPISKKYVTDWSDKYKNYCSEMSRAMSEKDRDDKKASANQVAERYKKSFLFHDAGENKGKRKSTEQLEEEALALYHVVYDHIINTDPKNVQKCGFVWKVAGTVLCKIYISKTAEDEPLLMSQSVLREVL